MRPDWPTEQLFFSRTGKPLDTRDARRLVEKLARLTGIARKVTPHTLRHTFATRFLRKGGSFGRPQDKPGVLQALLRPANPVTTARYLHPDKAQVQAMVEEM